MRFSCVSSWSAFCKPQTVFHDHAEVTVATEFRNKRKMFCEILPAFNNVEYFSWIQGDWLKSEEMML